MVAFVFMKDWGFKPTKSVKVGKDIKQLFTSSFEFSWHRPAIRWMMIAGPFISGVGFYVFYALQPFLLNLYGDKKAYAIAGVAAAIVAASQIVGSLLVPYLKQYFKFRTSVFLVATICVSVLLVLIGLTSQFWIAIGLLCLWGLLGAMITPVRQAYLNLLIPSERRATVLSFDSLVSSSGGAVIQPGLGGVADFSGYGKSFLVGAIIQGISLPFIYLSKRTKVSADKL
jgi:MFS family permease